MIVLHRKYRLAPLLWMIACAPSASSTAPGSQGASAAPTTPPAAQAQAAIVPLYDHHIHLFSPTAAALATPPLLPEVVLPPDLARLISARAARRQDQGGLAELYTADALYHRGGTAPWARGREAAAGHVKWAVSDTPYHIKPVAFNVSGKSANVAAYYVEADGTDRHFGSLLFALAKGPDGTWRIAAEMYHYFGEPRFEKPYTAAEHVAKMDAMGTRRGVVLSNAYYYDAVRPEPVPDEYAKVKADNDWTAEQVAQFPDRLVAFCSFNLLRPYALGELDRCAASGKFRGVKLHLNAAQLKFDDPAQVAAARAVIAAANRHRLAIVIHVRPGNTYGRAEAEGFLRHLVAAAPDVPVQVAHLWGGESFSGPALAVYAEAVAAGDPVTKNLYFDISGLTAYAEPKDMQEIVTRIRQIGVERIVYGSDAPPAEAWKAFQDKVPLTPEEFKTIAGNAAPYLR